MSDLVALPRFHDWASNLAISTFGPARWVPRLTPQRTIDFQFSVHYHPYVEELIQRLNVGGVDALLDPTFQVNLARDLAPTLYVPGPNVAQPFPRQEIDVSYDGPYAIYNWELCFHAPLLVAVHLSVNQRFEEAQRWFHRIFDPTTSDTSVPAPQRFWRFLRFRQEASPEFIAELLKELAQPGDSPIKSEMKNSIEAWRNNPFQPHVIARGRYLAYQMNVLMKYLDNLINWGDSLFRQDTTETDNEATQIYVLAANLLGPRPQVIPQRRKTASKTYRQLKAAGIDDFGNALIDMENELPFNSSGLPGGDASSSGAESLFGIGKSLYFCIPRNEQLLQYWDRVEDRLFKMRHCMNIEGVVRQLALFSPKLDPGMLVRAAAAGLDIASIVNNINQPTSTIRGPLLLQKAIELCSEVKALGGALLSALEKGDAEHMALLRQQYELSNLTMARDVRFLQWKEAEAATDALIKSRSTVWERYRHYKRILGAADTDINALKAIDLARTDLTEDNFDSVYADLVGRYAQALAREDYRKETTVGGVMEFAGNAVVNATGGQLGTTLPLNKNENAELNIFLPTADKFSDVAMAMSVIGSGMALIPQFDAHATPIGVGGAVGFGGTQLSSAMHGATQVWETVANAFKSSAERASKLAGYYRRAEDYVLQANLATSELEQYGRQILSALLREQTAKREYENHLKQIDQAQAQTDYMSSKFTNEDLYRRMQGAITSLYFDSYKFAFDTAKRAEATLQNELMRDEFTNLGIIRYGYWDSSRKGLLAGESLYLDLKRLELEALERNVRENELTAHVSLARLDPLALLKLKATGACDVQVPEWFFDMSCPGQYMRRIKTVSLSVPCVTGPYTSLHCKLSLLRSQVRTSPLKGDQYAQVGIDDSRFRDFAGAIQSIVTSSAQNDAGMFEVNLRDERFLPFEGAGAISDWRIELPNAVPQFDFETISDVVLHIRYTSRDASQLSGPASDAVKTVLGTNGNLMQLFCLNYEFASAWEAFRTAAADDARKLNVAVSANQFPYWTQRIGMNDALTATFGVIDQNKNQLIVATAMPAFAGDAKDGWTLSVDNNSPVFAFLKKHKDGKIYMAASYLA